MTRMKWVFCNNFESYELLSRNEAGTIQAIIYIDDEGVTLVSFKEGKSLMKSFKKGTNLLKVENYLKQELGI